MVKAKPKMPMMMATPYSNLVAKLKSKMLMATLAPPPPWLQIGGEGNKVDDAEANGKPCYRIVGVGSVDDTKVDGKARRAKILV